VEITGSVLGDGVRVGAGAALSGCIIGANVSVGEGARIDEDVVVGDGAVIAAGAHLSGPARVPTDGLVDDNGVRESEHAGR
jgi:carbonic anhydrase/acetyltransferase-like protein (isoleucine patch superfamily)